MTALRDTTIFTIGHSNHGLDHFLALLEKAGITALADVRSKPASRFCPHFNRENLKAALIAHGISYVYLGDALGGKPADPALYSHGRPDYRKIAASAAFKEGLARLMAGAKTRRIAMMCAERDPRQCHRTHLITPALVAEGVAITHILSDGGLLPHADLAADMTGGQFDLLPI
ncbi:MAG: DUF488 domain-containing protein [Sphingomonadales bacterium]|nr:DUF488 domain-containing protein [Sphingomonadales bacterium]